MQAVLITLGILGFGAVMISAYVFTVAARRYVHERVEDPGFAGSMATTEKLFITRSGRDRRRNLHASFPMLLPGGETILVERRRRERRRRVA